MGTAADIKINNLVDYIKECKGIIDIPTRRLLINEVAGVFLQRYDKITAPIMARLFIDRCIEENLAK